MVWWDGLVVWSGGMVRWYGLVGWSGRMVWCYGLVGWSGGMVWWYGLVGWSGGMVWWDGLVGCASAAGATGVAMRWFWLRCRIPLGVSMTYDLGASACLITVPVAFVSFNPDMVAFVRC